MRLLFSLLLSCIALVTAAKGVIPLRPDIPQKAPSAGAAINVSTLPSRDVVTDVFGNPVSEVSVTTDEETGTVSVPTDRHTGLMIVTMFADSATDSVKINIK